MNELSEPFSTWSIEIGAGDEPTLVLSINGRRTFLHPTAAQLLGLALTARAAEAAATAPSAANDQ